MGRKGPCFHCGIECSSIWRRGPPRKPVLCNSCGSKWKSSNSLRNYTPRHANSQSTMNNQSQGPGLAEPMLLNCSVPRRKRSALTQRIISPVERLHRQLYDILQEPEFSNLISDQEELIFQDNQTTYFETGLGAVLLKPPTAAANDTKTTSFVVDNEDTVLYDAPIKSVYSESIHSAGHVALESIRSTRLHARSRASHKGGHKSLKQIYSQSSHIVGVQIPLAAEGTQGQQNVQQPNGADLVTNRAFEQKTEFIPIHNSYSNAFHPEIVSPSELSRMLFKNTSKVDSLTDDVHKYLNLNNSGAMDKLQASDGESTSHCPNSQP